MDRSDYRRRVIRAIAGLVMAGLIATTGAATASANPSGRAAVPVLLPSEIGDENVVIAVPGVPQVDDPPGPGNATWIVPDDTAELRWVLAGDGELVVHTQDGFVFDDETTAHSFGFAPDSEVEDDPVQSAVPVITGEPVVGNSLTADVGQWEDGATLTIAWLADGDTIDAATDAQLTVGAALLGKRISVRVDGAKEGRRPVTEVSQQTLRVAQLGRPSISGSPVVGSTLTAAVAATPGATLDYQWLAGSAPIPGATGSKLTVGSAQSDQELSVRVTAAKPDHPTLTRTSDATLRVMRRATPKIVGYAFVGATVKAEPGSWTTDATLSYQWYADGKAVAGATKSTLKLSSAQKAKRLTVRVTGSRPDYHGTALTSSATGKVTVAATPTVSGSAVVGSTLTAKPGTWTTKTAFSYQWYADGGAIAGATKSTLKLSSSRKDRRLTVRVTGKKSGYATVARESKATAKVQLAPTPTVSGTAKVTYTLRAKAGTWSSGTAFRYQWYANGKAIKKATKSTLKISSAHAGKRISVKVTGTKSGYPTVTRTSKATGKVSYPNRTDPTSEWNCPSWAPIKGNANSGIYHVPGGAFYTRTKPEECFRTEAAARAAGYRKSKR